jgi:hypothetical protein
MIQISIEKIFPLSLLPFLISCATPYVAPAPNQDTATVEFRLFPNAENGSIYVFENRECANPMKVGDLVRNPERPLSHKIETTFAGGKELIVAFRTRERRGAFLYTCEPTIAFIPYARGLYAIELDKKYGECTARVTEWNSKTSKNEIPSTLSNFPPKCKIPN